jgi:hypothetical protein
MSHGGLLPSPDGREFVQEPANSQPAGFLSSESLDHRATKQLSDADGETKIV